MENSLVLKKARGHSPLWDRLGKIFRGQKKTQPDRRFGKTVGIVCEIESEWTITYSLSF